MYRLIRFTFATALAVSGALVQNAWSDLPVKPVSTGSVQVSGRQLLVDGVPYQIRGVGYQPIAVGQYPGSFNCYRQPLYQRDLPLLRRLGCNTIRTWGKINNDDSFLDACWNQGVNPIRIAAGFWIDPNQDFGDTAVRAAITADFSAYVGAYKDHPAILLWLPGGEINYPIWYDNARLQAWFSLLNDLGWAAYQVEGATYHPVTTDLAADVWEGATYIRDLVTEEIGSTALGTDDAHLSGLDLWGVNSYRGASFATPNRRGDLFADFAALSAKPLWLSEYGADAWDHGAGAVRERVQADRNVALWDLVAANTNVCGGAAVMAYSDEWWKNTASGAGPAVHDPGPWQRGDQPDGWTDEEYYGIVSVTPGSPTDSVTPRLAAYGLGCAWGLDLSQLEPGWNLVSAPAESAQTVAELFGGAGRAGRTAGLVFRLNQQSDGYSVAAGTEVVTPMIGYWVYGLPGAAPPRLQGTLATGTVTLQQGWNLIGPVGDVPRPSDARIAAVWGWDAKLQVHRPVRDSELLRCGQAYWVYATAEFDVKLAPE